MVVDQKDGLARENLFYFHFLLPASIDHLGIWNPCNKPLTIHLGSIL